MPGELLRAGHTLFGCAVSLWYIGEEYYNFAIILASGRCRRAVKNVVQVKIKLLVADEDPKVLREILSLFIPATGLGEPLNSTESSGQGPTQLPEPGDSCRGTSVEARVENACGHQVSVEITVIRKQLLDAIANIAKGGKGDSPDHGVEAYGLVTSPSVKPQLLLSPREKEVLLLIAGGMATKEVAFALVISPKTVDYHRDNIKKKIGLRSGAHLTRYAIENGWA